MLSLSTQLVGITQLHTMIITPAGIYIRMKGKVEFFRDLNSPLARLNQKSDTENVVLNNGDYQHFSENDSN